MMPGLFPQLPQVAPAEGSDVAYTPTAVAEACVRYLVAHHELRDPAVPLRIPEREVGEAA